MKTQDEIAESQVRVSRSALPRLRRIAIELETLGESMFRRSFEYHPDVGSDVMAVSFVAKQCEHMRSIRILIGGSQHRDAALISRIMLEGIGRLLWAFSDAPERTEQWLWFGAILDWRRTKRNESEGVWMAPLEKQRLMEYVANHGDKFIKSDVRKLQGEARIDQKEFQLPDDPWGKDWTDLDLRSMFVAVGGEKLYDQSYRLLSEWIHWNPRGILSAVDPDRTEVLGFSKTDWRAAATAMQIGAQALQQTLEVANMQFSLGLDKALSRMDEELVVELTEILEEEKGGRR